MLDRGASIKKCACAAFDIFADRTMAGDDLDTTAAICKVLSRSGRFPVAIVVNHQHVAAGFHFSGKNLIGGHNKGLLKTGNRRKYLSAFRTRLLSIVCWPVWQVRL